MIERLRMFVERNRGAVLHKGPVSEESIRHAEQALSLQFPEISGSL